MKGKFSHLHCTGWTVLSASGESAFTFFFSPSDARPLEAPNSRESILDAAEALVLDAGAAHLTLDAVAERAGVSKGGLLYNYATKEALLQAMIARHVEHIAQMQAATLERLPAGPGRELKACLLTAIDAKKHSKDRCLATAMIAASANDPKLLDPIRELHHHRLAQLIAATSTGTNFERAALVSLAVDGLLLTEMLQVSPFSPGQRQRIVAEILRMIDEEMNVSAAGNLRAATVR